MKGSPAPIPIPPIPILSPPLKTTSIYLKSNPRPGLACIFIARYSTPAGWCSG
ncbi:hypothetical protein HanXRQr2_Chr02g0081381 [Helianthus annuus]|uniref:Uncharacterized protein n=1 Tax=Helianthus annuus TaxID=4232 RepID=A0A251VJL7_HELAN|nr:hypothetical protein HanXRQr2_Chr02g0081381 [Helianthus annuus]KAJ0605895.1 hypothetical protein HanHA300_Chr02g0068101 [Helianthus annuus]KAJ0616782.1 hypothetical protein HanIR_Chr02g0094341 [Helianthus annuus]KAJ0619891.1 hypothetical protein HanHA89_Chr02g0076351 [Helianthus annuus]KAJ0787323.1 hypothetical protein HanOQP8_Chr02g0081241 [Helianthus annuus]